MIKGRVEMRQEKDAFWRDYRLKRKIEEKEPKEIARFLTQSSDRTEEKEGSGDFRRK